MNLYAVLGVSKDADEATIRSAYRMLARRYHPDSGAGSSTEKFRHVIEAYQTLGDSRRRHFYDLSLQATPKYSKRCAESLIRMPQRRNAFDYLQEAGYDFELRSLYRLNDLFDELNYFIDEAFFRDLY